MTDHRHHSPRSRPLGRARFSALLALACIALVVLPACRSGDPAHPPPELGERHAMNVHTIHGYYEEMRDAAIIREHTLYPHHFVSHDDQLNELGRRDLALLAKHHRQTHDSPINLRRGEVSGQLYEARAQTVARTLREMGIPDDQIEIVDGLPGGDGMSSDRAVLILLTEPVRSARPDAAPASP